jgi:ribosomal protein L24E
VVMAAVTFGIGPSSPARTASAAKASTAQAPARSVRTIAATSSSVAAETNYSGGHLMAADPNGGYWTVSWLGAVTAHGGASSFGSPALSGIRLAQPIVGMAATPDGGGYWLVATDGGIFSYGDAKFYGSTGAIHLNQPIVGMAATSNGAGYWLVASDGGIFTFGNAKFSGSTGALHLNQPVVGMAAAPGGAGYWLVASDGGIFTFGSAKFYGSTGALHLNKPIVGMAATPDGQGYWLVASDGGIFTYGDAPFDGTLGGSNVVLGVLVNPTATAYTEVTSNGAVDVPTLTPAPATPSASSVAAGSSPTAFGLSVPSLVSDTASQQAAALANMKSIGLQWVRVDMDWDWIQPDGPTTYEWTNTDQEVQAINAAGMSADLIIDDTPPWARNASADQTWGEPASATTYATFAGAVAAHYGPMGVKTYEIWNEENIQQFWYPAPNPTLYTAMLKDAYAAIKAAEPDSLVISGGLAPAADDSAGDIAPIEFLQDMYADGAQGSFDAVGDHAYSFPALPDTFETWSPWSQMDQTSPSLRSVMTANGDAAKQIWITEIGAPTAGPDGVGTTFQAEDVTQAVAGAKATPWIGAVFFYTYEDAATDPDYYGLLNADGSAKPAWAALAAALAA